MCAYEMPSLLGSPARGSWRASSGGRGASGGPVTQAHRTSPCPQRDAARGRRPMCCSALTAASPDAPAPLGIFERLLQEGGGRGADWWDAQRGQRSAAGCVRRKAAAPGISAPGSSLPSFLSSALSFPTLTQSPKEPISIICSIYADVLNIVSNALQDGRAWRSNGA